MNKTYKELYIDKAINLLIQEKENLSQDIGNIASYINFSLENQDLTSKDIQCINSARNKVSVIYQIIEDLERLKQEVKQDKQN